MNDQELIQAWATQHSESAFAELVRRHIGLVYASAFRQVHEPEIARDVTQAVFLLLAQKAKTLSPSVILSGWLFRTTTFMAIRAQRTEFRRQRREQQTVAMDPSTDASPGTPERWFDLEPHLDAALNSLSSADRDAVLLRYFERLPIREVSMRLRVSEESAKKRLQRAVEKLRHYFQGKGIWLTAVSLPVLLQQMPVEAAPVDLAGFISRTALTGPPAPVADLVSGGARDWIGATFRGWLPWATVTLVLLFSLGWGARSWWSEGSGRELASTALGPNDSGQLSASESASPDSQDGAQLELTVLSALSDQPLPSQVHLEYEWDGKTQDEIDLPGTGSGPLKLRVRKREFDSVKAWVSAANHTPVLAIWRQHEFGTSALAETFRLVPGKVLQGTVVDESGEPVEGARIRLALDSFDPGRRQNPSFHPRFHALTSDARGRFESRQIPSLDGQSLTLTVEHPEFIQGSLLLDRTQLLATNQVVILRTGVWVYGQVVSGAEGNPVGDIPLRGENGITGERRQTIANETGHFALGPFPGGSLKLTLLPAGSVSVSSFINLTRDQRDLLVYLPAELPFHSEDERSEPMRRIQLVGRVTDQDTGQPLTSFRVRLQDDRSGDATLLGVGANGHFDWPLSVKSQSKISLEVEAEGYDLTVTPPQEVAAEVAEFSIQLNRGRAISGWVVDTTGQPVAGAFVGLTGGTYGYAVNSDGRPIPRNKKAPKTETDLEGWFSFQSREDAESVLIVCPSGCSQIPVGQLGRVKIQLAPWGAIHGTWTIPGMETNTHWVSLEQWVPEDPQLPLGIDIEWERPTATQGSFKFDQVPAGPINLVRNRTLDTSSNIQRAYLSLVKVRAGEVTEVTFDGGGRNVVARIESSPTSAGSGWETRSVQLAKPGLFEEPTDPSSMEGAVVLRAEKIKTSWRRHMSSLDFESTPDANGNVFFPAIPAGEYELAITFERLGQLGQSTRSNRIASEWKQRIVVPPDDSGDNASPLDLGVIQAPQE